MLGWKMHLVSPITSHLRYPLEASSIADKILRIGGMKDEKVAQNWFDPNS